ncbi:EamA family transporter [Solilutibacter silvestris]|uniref:EamA family transporter n=1 Tax=Solilutibacter silvestris TaxID=1645665 RepID=UPI003D34673E
MNILVLIAIVIAASIGQVLLKLAVAGVKHENSMQWLSLLHNVYFWGGVLTYGLTSIAWLWALKTFPLSKAYPMLALTFVTVPLLAHLCFGETIKPINAVGIAVIVIGVILVNSGSVR